MALSMKSKTAPTSAIKKAVEAAPRPTAALMPAYGLNQYSRRSCPAPAIFSCRYAVGATGPSHKPKRMGIGAGDAGSLDGTVEGCELAGSGSIVKRKRSAQTPMPLCQRGAWVRSSRVRVFRAVAETPVHAVFIVLAWRDELHGHAS